MTSDPKILGLALLGGIIPSLIWLWFWLKEDNAKPEPKGIIATIFIIGMLSVSITIPIQKLIQANIPPGMWQTILWASVEEFIKYLSVFILLRDTDHLEQPIDWAIVLITSALGFAALENAMFLLEPIAGFWKDSLPALITGQLRFLGSTLLHAVSSGIIGITLGLSFYMGRLAKKIYLLIGIVLAISLHSAFNFFIMGESGNNFLQVFGFLWIITIIVILLFEKLRRMSV